MEISGERAETEGEGVIRAGVRLAANNWIARQEDEDAKSRERAWSRRGSGLRVLFLKQPGADSGVDVEGLNFRRHTA